MQYSLSTGQVKLSRDASSTTCK